MRITKGEILYFIYFGILEIGIAIWSDTQNKAFRASILFASIVLLIKIMYTRYTKLERNILGIFFILSIFIMLTNHRITSFLTVFTILGMKGIDIDRIFKFSFFIRLGVFLAYIIGNKLEIIENVYYTIYRNDVLVERVGLGYPYPNMCQLAFCIIVILFIYNFYKWYNIAFAFAILMINLYLYKFTYSRTSYYTCIFICIFAFILKNKFFCRFKNTIYIYIIPVAYALTITITMLYGKVDFIYIIDKMLSSRIIISNYYLNKYGLSLFGCNIMNETNVLDSGLLSLLINYGIIYTLLFIIIMMIISKKMVELKEYRKILLIVGFTIIGITESITPMIFSNLSLLLFGEFLYNINYFIKGKGHKVENETIN